MIYFNIYDRNNKLISSYGDDSYFCGTNKTHIVISRYGSGKIERKFTLANHYCLKQSTAEPQQQPTQIEEPQQAQQPAQEQPQQPAQQQPKTSKAQLDAVKKYQQSRAEMRLRVSPEIKQLADKQAQSKGLSLTAYISQLIQEDAQSRAEADRHQKKHMELNNI